MFLSSILLSIMICPFVLGQTENFEQECNILRTLETLETRLGEQETRMGEKATRLGEQETRLGEQATRLGEQETRMGEQETRLGEQEAEIAVLKQQNSELTRQRTSSAYVRWGRTSCPGNGSELVYSGYAGGSHHTHVGAAVDFLCLPTDPTFALYDDKVPGGAFVYGAEYEMNARTFATALDKDVPCAVCKTIRPTVLMVPARSTCHTGWTLEYNGYLSSGRYNHNAATQYVCLDENPEYLEGGSGNDNGKLFYFVNSKCGSLRCPPYEEGRELTCVVCSL